MRPVSSLCALALFAAVLCPSAAAQEPHLTVDDYTESPWTGTPPVQHVLSNGVYRYIVSTAGPVNGVSVGGGAVTHSGLLGTHGVYLDGGEVVGSVYPIDVPFSPLLDVSDYDSVQIRGSVNGLNAGDAVEIYMVMVDPFALSFGPGTVWFGPSLIVDSNTAFVYSAQLDDFGPIDLTEIAGMAMVVESVGTSPFTGNVIAEPMTFELPPPPPPVNYCTAGTSASGCTVDISVFATPSASLNAGGGLTAVGMDPLIDGLFFFGVNGRQAQPWGSGTSFQCVVPPVTRTPLVTSSPLFPCFSGASVNLNGLWCSTCPQPAKNPGPGAVVQAQYWYRDPQNTSNQTTSLSNAVEFTVAP